MAEVLSESTEGYDWGGKFDHSQTIPTLTDYLLVAQDQSEVILYTRREHLWEYQTVNGHDSRIHLSSIAVTLALAEVYPLIEFSP